MKLDVDRLKRGVCSVVGHKKDKDGWQQLHYYGIGGAGAGEGWITPETPCAIVCYRCGEPIRWLVKETCLEGKIDQLGIKGTTI